MEIIFLSYPGGMFGEFTTNLISSANINKFFQPPVEITPENRFIYANLLSPIGMNIKGVPHHKPISITDEQIKTLYDTYGGKSIVVPTHWYNKDSDLHQIRKIRLICTDALHKGIACCSLWIKSALHSNFRGWPEKMLDIREQIALRKPNYQIMQNLLDAGEYASWKFTACEVNALTNGEPDLRKMINYHFAFFEIVNKTHFTNKWQFIDIGNAIFNNDGAEQEKLDAVAEMPISREDIEKYKTANLQMLKEKLSIKEDDFAHPPRWIPALTDYCLKNVQQPIA